MLFNLPRKSTHTNEKNKLNKNCIQKVISHQLATRKLNSICGTLMKAQLFSGTVLSCYNFSGENKGVGIRKDVSPDSWYSWRSLTEEKKKKKKDFSNYDQNRDFSTWQTDSAEFSDSKSGPNGKSWLK